MFVEVGDGWGGWAHKKTVFMLEVNYVLAYSQSKNTMKHKEQTTLQKQPYNRNCIHATATVYIRIIHTYKCFQEQRYIYKQKRLYSNRYTKATMHI